MVGEVAAAAFAQRGIAHPGDVSTPSTAHSTCTHPGGAHGIRMDVLSGKTIFMLLRTPVTGLCVPVRACPCRSVLPRALRCWCEVQIRNGERGHTQHAAQGQAQRERGTSDTPRPKALV